MSKAEERWFSSCDLYSLSLREAVSRQRKGGGKGQRQGLRVMEGEALWRYLVHKDTCSRKGGRKLLVDLVVLDNRCSGDEGTRHSASIQWTASRWAVCRLAKMGKPKTPPTQRSPASQGCWQGHKDAKGAW